MAPGGGFSASGEAFLEPGGQPAEERRLSRPAQAGEGELQRPAQFRLSPELPAEADGPFVEGPAGPLPGGDQGPSQLPGLLGLEVRLKEVVVQVRGFLADLFE